MQNIDPAFLKKYKITTLRKLTQDDVYMLTQLCTEPTQSQREALMQGRTGVVAEAISANPTWSSIQILKSLEPWLDIALGDYTHSVPVDRISKGT